MWQTPKHTTLLKYVTFVCACLLLLTYEVAGLKTSGGAPVVSFLMWHARGRNTYAMFCSSMPPNLQETRYGSEPACPKTTSGFLHSTAYMLCPHSFKFVVIQRNFPG